MKGNKMKGNNMRKIIFERMTSFDELVDRTGLDKFLLVEIANGQKPTRQQKAKIARELNTSPNAVFPK